MPITVVCQSCKKSLKAPDNAAGKKAKCPQCGTVVVVPSPAPAQPAAKPAAPAKPLAPAPWDVDLPPRSVDDETQVCPYCGGTIPEIATECEHCGESLKQAAPAAPPPEPLPTLNRRASSAPQRSRLVAGLLSFLIPGLGQLYKGQILRGVVWFVAVFIGYLFLILPGLVLHVCCIVGAASAERA